MIKYKILLLLFFLWSFNTFSQNKQVSVQVSTFKLKAPQLNTEKKIWLYLPQNYATSNKKYSVIYMHDAQNLFDSESSYSGEWNIDEKLDSLQAQVIVVGIEHGNEKRIEELTPFKNEKYGGGKADDYLEFIVKTVKPKIDSTYRTKPDTKNTLIAGSSLGGLTSFYATLKYPDVFGKAVVFSPSFWFSDEIYNYAQSREKIKSKIYFMCGDNESADMVKDLNKMENLINSKRCYCLHLNEKKIVKGGQHNEKLWRDGFVKAIQWLKF
jgi:alpha-glucosidase|tara:strand:- start:626 stop:1429 length:804 start_codon:yes stop_codon:yes gene_type:complete